jgi:tRNA dimethylallyltransferase
MPTNPHQKTVIIVTGPTASGKTAVAIDIATHFQTEIISADSRQCYRELNIGVARPSDRELRQVKHHFIASHSIQEEVTAAVFEQYALEKTQALFQHNDTVVMAGGTGLYIKAFCEGLDFIPRIEVETRERIIRNYEKEGLPWLQEQIREKDPVFFSQGEIQNPQRMMRALEVVESTGQSILSFRSKKKIKRDFNIVKIGLELPKETLHQHINHRTDQMMKAGLLEEVKNLQPYKKLNALQTVGYTELFDYLNAVISLDKAVELIKQNTRRYAKRQLTWLKKDTAINWIPLSSVNELILKLSNDFNVH